ncbi:MAG: RNA-binding S4 domain-containing protein [Erysipelotrichaceae bacterium]
MRVDKYLKVARVLKRRAISKELADNDRIIVNGRIAKPSTDIQVNDEITIIFGNRSLKIKVIELAMHTKKEEASDLYEVIEENRIETQKHE